MDEVGRCLGDLGAVGGRHGAWAGSGNDRGYGRLPSIPTTGWPGRGSLVRTRSRGAHLFLGPQLGVGSPRHAGPGYCPVCQGVGTGPTPAVVARCGRPAVRALLPGSSRGRILRPGCGGVPHLCGHRLEEAP